MAIGPSAPAGTPSGTEIVNADRIREVKPLHKGEYAITLADGTVFDSGRTYRAVVERFLDLLRVGR